jgi:hypothetical protein
MNGKGSKEKTHVDVTISERDIHLMPFGSLWSELAKRSGLANVTGNKKLGTYKDLGYKYITYRVYGTVPPLPPRKWSQGMRIRKRIEKLLENME